MSYTHTRSRWQAQSSCHHLNRFNRSNSPSWVRWITFWWQLTEIFRFQSLNRSVCGSIYSSWHSTLYWHSLRLVGIQHIGAWQRISLWTVWIGELDFSREDSSDWTLVGRSYLWCGWKRVWISHRNALTTNNWFRSGKSERFLRFLIQCFASHRKTFDLSLVSEKVNLCRESVEAMLCLWVSEIVHIFMLCNSQVYTLILQISFTPTLVDWAKVRRWAMLISGQTESFHWCQAAWQFFVHTREHGSILRKQFNVAILAIF